MKMLESSEYFEKLESRLFVLLDKGPAQRKGASLSLQSLLGRCSQEKKKELSERVLYRLENANGPLIDDLALSISLGIGNQGLGVVLKLLNPETNHELERTMVPHLSHALVYMDRASGLNDTQQREISSSFNRRLQDAAVLKNSWMLIGIFDPLANSNNLKS